MEFLRQSNVCTGAVGVVGYCWGGLLSYLTAANQSPDAAVAYYGVGIEKHLDKANQITCPMLFHYASKDAFAGPDVAAKVRETFQDKNAQVWEYADAGHAFARPGGSHYHHPSADLADMRTLAFLVEHLIGNGKTGTMTV
jgi:carboxymethylenebutenolidase